MEISHVVRNMEDAAVKKNIVLMGLTSEKSQNLLKVEEKMDFVVMDLEVNPT